LVGIGDVDRDDAAALVSILEAVSVVFFIDDSRLEAPSVAFLLKLDFLADEDMLNRDELSLSMSSLTFKCWLDDAVLVRSGILGVLLVAKLG
jgi:hypothetical protein